MIRLSVQQPALPKYRLPLFRRLALQDGIRMRLFYGQLPCIPNVGPEALDGKLIPQRVLARFGAHTFYWHAAQWRNASSRASDILVLLWDIHYLSLVPALLRARLADVPVLLYGHGYSKDETPSRRWLRNMVARLATAVVVYNRGAARCLVANGFKEHRVFVALNAIDQAPIQQARCTWLGRHADLQALRAGHRLVPGQTILFVSRLHASNRLDLLLEATARLVSHLPDLRVVIIGEGEPEGTRLRALAARLALTKHILFPGAIYDEDRLAPWFLCSDVFCYPLNIGLSLLHAFGYGLPVVTSNAVAKQNPEIEALRHGENGLFYQDGDVSSLAAVLLSVLGDAAYRERMSQRACRTALEDFTLDATVAGLQAAIRYCDSVRTLRHQA